MTARGSSVLKKRKAIIIRNAEHKKSDERVSAGLLLIGLAYLGFVSLGLPDGLHGVAWPFIRATFHLPLDALGTLLVMFTIGYLLSSFSSGRLLAHMNVGALLAFSCLLMAISLAGYALTPRWLWMVALGTVAGAGSGAIDAGLNTYAATHFSPRTVNLETKVLRKDEHVPGGHPGRFGSPAIVDRL